MRGPRRIQIQGDPGAPVRVWPGTGIFDMSDGRIVGIADVHARRYLGPIPMPWHYWRREVSVSGHSGTAPVWAVEPGFMRRRRLRDTRDGLR